MKKILVSILIFISMSLYSQEYKTISDLSFSVNTFGFDIGYLNNNKTIVKIDCGFYYKNIIPAYLNINYGYNFIPKIYLSGIIGIYAPYNYTESLKVNYGGEITYISMDNDNYVIKGYIINVFYTSNIRGIKVGFVF
jgi:hypothetical protein